MNLIMNSIVSDQCKSNTSQLKSGTTSLLFATFPRARDLRRGASYASAALVNKGPHKILESSFRATSPLRLYSILGTDLAKFLTTSLHDIFQLQPQIPSVLGGRISDFLGKNEKGSEDSYRGKKRRGLQIFTGATRF